MGDIWKTLEKRAKMENLFYQTYGIFLNKMHRPIFIKDGVPYYEGDEVCCKTKMFSGNQFSAVLHKTDNGKPFAQLTVNDKEYKIKVSKKNIIKKYQKIIYRSVEEREEMVDNKEIDMTDRIVDLFKQISDYQLKHPKDEYNDATDLLIMNTAKNIINYLTKKPVLDIAGVFFYEGDKVRHILTGITVDGILSYEPNESSYYLKTDTGAKQYIDEYTRLVNLDREPLCEDKNGVRLKYGDKVIDRNISVFGKPLIGIIDIDTNCKVFINATCNGMKMSICLPDYEFTYKSIEKMEEEWIAALKGPKGVQ